MNYKIAVCLSAVILATSAMSETPAPATDVDIRLASDPAKSLWAEQGKVVKLSTVHASKFKILPGLTDATLVSIEPAGLVGFYLRHTKRVIIPEKRPSFDEVFDRDATFRLVHLDGDKVRFEARGFPGMFIAVRDDGLLMLARDPSPENSTFVFGTGPSLHLFGS